VVPFIHQLIWSPGNSKTRSAHNCNIYRRKTSRGEVYHFAQPRKHALIAASCVTNRLSTWEFASDSLDNNVIDFHPVLNDLGGGA
jgi:hypothetical protein